MNTKLRNLLVAACTATALSFPTAAIADSGDPEPTVPVGVNARTADEDYHVGPTAEITGPIESGLTGTKKRGGGISTLAVEFSPAGCEGKTDYPHKSGGTQASVHGRTDCDSTTTSVSVTTTLKRLRWYGYETLATDSSTKSASTWSEDAHPHWTCTGTGTYSYYGYSSHSSLENGKTYTANTSNYKEEISRFAC